MLSATTVNQFHRPSKQRRTSPNALMYVTVGFMWTSVWRFQDLWPLMGKLQIPLVLEATLAALVLANLVGSKDLRWMKSRVFAIPFLLLAIMVLGMPSSIWAGKALTFVLRDFIPSLLLMTAVAASVRSANDLDWLAFAHLLGATLYSVLTLLFVAVGSDGRLGGGGSYYDANDFALLLVCTIPFAIYFLRPGVTTWRRVFALGSLLLFVVMLIKSGSRGGFIAFVALILYIVVAFRSIPKRQRLFAVAAATIIMALFGTATYWNLIQSIAHPDNDYNMTEQTGRKFIWKRGVGYMIAHPLLGVGAANFEQAEGTESKISQQYATENRGLKWSAAHNSFVLVGAELGIGGMVLFVVMIGTSFYRLAQVREHSDDHLQSNIGRVAYAQMLIASLVGYCIAGFFVSASYFSLLYALIGLIVAEDAIEQHCGIAAARESVPRRLRDRGRKRTQRETATVAHWSPTGHAPMAG